MAQAILKGTRLAYVVQEIEGFVRRPVTTWSKKEGMRTKMVEQPAGYLVYFPRGHFIRIKDLKTLRHYGLDKEPALMQLEGLHDPRSPLGKLFFAQEASGRQAAWRELENQVIKLATAKTGPVDVQYDPENPNSVPVATAGATGDPEPGGGKGRKAA